MVNREYHKWYTARLSREMELLVFGHAGARVLVFPTRSGRFYDYEDWGLVAALGAKLECGALQLFCVDSIDAESIYCSWCHPRNRIVRHMQYEAYLLREVVPFTVACNAHHLLAAHGCSLGAFHAVNIAFRHPHLFRKVVALSGRYDLTIPLGPFPPLFDGYYDQDVYFHTPSHYIPNLDDPGILYFLRQMEIIFAVGEEDPFCANTWHLSNALAEKDVANACHIWSGEAHRARYWREMVELYL